MYENKTLCTDSKVDFAWETVRYFISNCFIHKLTSVRQRELRESSAICYRIARHRVVRGVKLWF